VVSGSYGEPNELLVVALHSAEHLLAVALQLLQLLLDDGGVQRLALLHQRLALLEDVLDLGSGEGDLLLEGLRGAGGGRGRMNSVRWTQVSLTVF